MKKKKTTSAEIIKMTEEYGVETYSPLPVVLVRGKGPWVWDIEGKRYLDMLSCYSALSHGHCNPRIFKVLKKQAGILANVSRAFYNEQYGYFCKELAEFAGFPKVLLMNTGAEAVEKAIKAAKKWSYMAKGVALDKAEIIACEGNFHGRTNLVLSFSTEKKYTKYFGPYPPGAVKIPYGDAEALERAITPNTAAFLVEPIQGEGGVIVPPTDYLKMAKEICARHNVLFIADEIQTGLGRTGKKFAYEYEDAKPDILVLGKALGAGPAIISAVLFSEKISGDALMGPGEDGSTFSGSPLSCAVAREGLKVLVEEGLIENSYEMGNYLRKELTRINSPYVKETRGRGLLIAVEIKKEFGDAKPFCLKLMEEGVLCKDTHGQSIRFAPVLTIKKKEIDWAIKKIRKVLTIPLEQIKNS
jgi:ornithine--oxo-acid transaminase